LKLALSTLFALTLFAAHAHADDCPAGTEPKADGGCAPKIDIQCPAGTIFEEGRGCVAKVLECPPSMVLEANKCVAKPAPPPPPEPTKPEPTKPEGPPAPAGPPKRFQLAVRLGFALPLLNAYRSPKDQSAVALSDEVVGSVPIGLEIGHRVMSALYLGGVVTFGPAFPREASDGYCQPNATSCGGDHLRVAFQARVYPLRAGVLEPWIGLGFGYERLELREEGTLATGDTGGVATTLSGIEYFELSAGADFEVLRDVRLGPLLSFALGQYGRATVQQTSAIGTTTSSNTIKDPAVHGWLQLGVRGAFGLF
jgi:hypothetical protein